MHLARGRASHYEVIDFSRCSQGYARSSEPTLAAFFERIVAFAGSFMALFGVAPQVADYLNLASLSPGE